MRFMMVLKSHPLPEAGVLPDQEMLTQMGNYTQAMADAGILLAAEGLHASSEGARVRIAGGKTRVLDGPFAEAKEVVAGFWLIKTKTKQEAIEWTKRMPGKEGEIELRELYEAEDFPIDPSEQPDGWREHEQKFREQQHEGKPAARARSGTRRYMSLLMADKNTEAAMLPSPKLLAEMGALMQEMTAEGVLLSGDGLKPSSHGSRIAFSGSKRTVVDGPFAETKELVAGVCIYRAKSKAEAVEWARRCLQIHIDGTGIGEGMIEVRQVFDLDEFPVDASERPGGWRDQEKALRERLGE